MPLRQNTTPIPKKHKQISPPPVPSKIAVSCDAGGAGTVEVVLELLRGAGTVEALLELLGGAGAVGRDDATMLMPDGAIEPLP